MQKVSIAPYFLPPKQPKNGVNRRFQVKTTNAIPTKCCIVVNTIKFSLWVISKFVPQIKMADFRHFEKDKLLYLSKDSTDF